MIVESRLVREKSRVDIRFSEHVQIWQFFTTTVVRQLFQEGQFGLIWLVLSEPFNGQPTDQINIGYRNGLCTFVLYRSLLLEVSDCVIELMLVIFTWNVLHIVQLEMFCHYSYLCRKQNG